jgi:hypothetical protein
MKKFIACLCVLGMVLVTCSNYQYFYSRENPILFGFELPSLPRLAVYIIVLVVASGCIFCQPKLIRTINIMFFSYLIALVTSVVYFLASRCLASILFTSSSSMWAWVCTSIIFSVAEYAAFFPLSRDADRRTLKIA